MTLKTSDFSGLLYYNPGSHGFNPVQQATINCADSMNEYDSINVNVVTWDLPDGTLFWRVVPYGTNLTLGRFTLGSSDSTLLVNNRASFTIAVSADDLTSPDQQSFDIIISKTENGPALATRLGVVVNDTSQDPQILVMDLDPANYVPANSSTITVTLTFPNAAYGFLDGSGGSYFRYNGSIPTQPSVGDTFVVSAQTYTIYEVNTNYPSGQEQYYLVGFKPYLAPEGALAVNSTIDITHGSTGLTIADASGQNHPGTLSNGVGYSGSGNTSYFTLDGVNDFITVPSLQNSTYKSVTMSLWFNPSGTDGSLITKELSYKMRLSGTHLNVMLKSSSAGGWNYNTTDNSVTIASGWHYLAVTVNPETVTWYLDNVVVHVEASPGELHANSQPFMIGSYGQGTSEFFTGKIGPARLYNYAVSGSDLSTYYNATKDRYQTATPMSFVFNGSSDYREITGTTSDWVMDNATIEFWSKAAASSVGHIYTVMCQQPGSGIDIFYEGGKLKVPNTTGGYLQWDEPTPGQWTHVALFTLYGQWYVFYNGVQQGSVQTGVALNNSSATLFIGRRQGNFQYFNGKLTGIRINGNIQYIDIANIQNFYPYSQALPPTKVLGTRLLLNPNNNAMFDDLSDSNHTFGGGSVGNADDYPGLVTYTHQYGTSAPSGYTSASLIWNDVLAQTVIGWTMTGPDVPPGTTVLTQTSNGNQTFMTISHEINYHAVNYTFIAP